MTSIDKFCRKLKFLIFHVLLTHPVGRGEGGEDKNKGRHGAEIIMTNLSVWWRTIGRF